eukprot:5381492-Pleurochrysis_carterae.AAC.1
MVVLLPFVLGLANLVVRCDALCLLCIGEEMVRVHVSFPLTLSGLIATARALEGREGPATR